MGPLGVESAPLGAHASTQGTSNPSTRTGILPRYLAPSLMPQLHDALEQEAGGESAESALVTPGMLPHGHPAR